MRGLFFYAKEYVPDCNYTKLKRSFIKLKYEYST